MAGVKVGAENWRELLDDPEISRMVQRVVRMTPRTGDPYLDDDLDGWLWERAIRIATRYELRTGADDPARMWQAYLWTSLRKAAPAHRNAIYGRPGSARRDAESTRTSVDAIMEATGNTPRHRGSHQLRHNDPLYHVLHIERLEAVLRYVTARGTTPGATYTTVSDLCTEPMCLRKAITRGLCRMHAQRVRYTYGYAGQPACTIDGCDRPSTARGWCDPHYRQARRANSAAWAAQAAQRPVGCKVPGCDAPHKGRGYCHKHWRQAKREGQR